MRESESFAEQGELQTDEATDETPETNADSAGIPSSADVSNRSFSERSSRLDHAQNRLQVSRR
jgi:hypothetical protein